MKTKYLLTALTLALTSAGYAAEPAPAVPQTQSQAGITATGTVLDSDGEPVIGASVTPAGLKTGVATDIDGKFEISVKPGTMLTISYIGHKPVTVKAAQGLTIRLESEASVLDDVVVVGYGTQKKKLVTGATVQVKGEDVAKQNTVDVIGALQSQTPGVNITQSNGFIGQGF